MPGKRQRLLEVVVPVFNENETLVEFFRRFNNEICKLDIPTWKISLIFVNDGSTDSTSDILNKLLERKYIFDLTVLNLSRNFGHQQAVWAGIENTSAKSCVLVMDADLQDPPEKIREFLLALEEFDVVMARRISRNDSVFKKMFASIFYGLLSKLSGGSVRANVGDFWALSERAKNHLLRYNEELKFLRGLVSDLGFPVKVIDYSRDARYAGRTKYSLFKMVQLAIAGVTGFTIKPLIYTVYVAIFLSFLLIPAAVFLVWNRVIGDNVISPGLTFVGVVVIISIGLQFIVLSVLALYLARVALEVKKRPIYILESTRQHLKGTGV